MYAHHRHNNNYASDVLVLGETTWRRQHRRFGLLAEDRLRHLYVLGKTGSGKSTLLAHLLAQDLARGQGLALLDPHGDLVEAVLSLVPADRTNQVLLFDPTDREYPVSWNILRDGTQPAADSTNLVGSSVLSVFKKEWHDSWGPRLEHVLRNALFAVIPYPDATILTLYRFLTEDALREKVVARVTDPIVRTFWEIEWKSYPASLRAEALSPVMNKLGSFLASSEVRNIVAATRSRVDLVSMMDERAILLAPLNAGRLGEDRARLLGGLLMSTIELAARRRARGGPPFYVYIDEFQHFVTESIALLLAEARKFGLGLVLAHQYLAQLPEHITSAVLGSAGSMVLFRLGAEDATRIAPELEPTFTALDLEQQPMHHFLVKMQARGAALPPFSARSVFPPQAGSAAAERTLRIRAQSRQRFARPRQDVERDILRSLNA